MDNTGSRQPDRYEDGDELGQPKTGLVKVYRHHDNLMGRLKFHKIFQFWFQSHNIKLL